MWDFTLTFSHRLGITWFALVSTKPACNHHNAGRHSQVPFFIAKIAGQGADDADGINDGFLKKLSIKPNHWSCNMLVLHKNCKLVHGPWVQYSQILQSSWNTWHLLWNLLVRELVSLMDYSIHPQYKDSNQMPRTWAIQILSYPFTRLSQCSAAHITQYDPRPGCSSPCPSQTNSCGFWPITGQ